MRVVCAYIEDFHEPFDVGIALHACGGASDVVGAVQVENSISP